MSLGFLFDSTHLFLIQDIFGRQSVIFLENKTHHLSLLKVTSSEEKLNYREGKSDEEKICMYICEISSPHCQAKATFSDTS